MAYNLIRLQMLQSCAASGRDPRSLSFTTTLQLLATDGTGTAGSDVTIDATLPGNADYTASTASFMLGAGTNFTQEIVLSAIDDSRLEAPRQTFANQALMIQDTGGAGLHTNRSATGHSLHCAVPG